ncbi:MFS general substrate transporter [Trametes punicea]|nr:MFS general substrate transporter [Trametes punicea]
MTNEKQVALQDTPARSRPGAVPDIEHAVVVDDPRAWSNARKLSVVATVSAASMIAGLGGNIYNREHSAKTSVDRPGCIAAISQIEEQLHASSGEISLSLSLFIVIQGAMPLIWSALSEFWGRKRVYLVSTALCVLGCIVAALSKTIGVLIGMRCIQALGSSAVIALGAATLADIYEPSERGTMMGIYYSAPLLGPSLGPILGGGLTKGFSWRATFWFLAIFVGVCFLLFIPFKDTFRRERSLVYQTALRRRLAHQSAKSSEASSLSQVTAVSRIVPATDDKTRPAAVPAETKDAIDELARDRDLEKQQQQPANNDVVAPMNEIRLSLADVNPVKPIIQVLRRLNNLTILSASGLIFAFSYSIAYTCSRTLANEYGYDALQIGLVLLAYGVGSLFGSVLGGRYSDYVFRKLKARNGGTSSAEMRLESTMVPMFFLPPSVIAYGWVCERHVNVAAICVMLFLSGFFSICIYSSTLAYIVDANTGRSSSAVATNSAFRGLSAFVAAEVAVPLQVCYVLHIPSSSPHLLRTIDAIGDGGLYSLWAGIMLLSELLILLVWWKGGEWREKWERKERDATKS